MATMPTQTVAVSVDADPTEMTKYLADATTHPEWATEFFSDGAEEAGDGTWSMNVPRMGGPVRVKIDAVTALGVIDMYLAPEGTPFGPPLPIRVLPNGDGCDVTFTLARFPGQSDEDWADGVTSMQRELENLKARWQS